MIGSSLNFIGLILLAASTYQIMKTMLLLFLMLQSVIFLRRHYNLTQWLAMLTVVIGLGVVSIHNGESPEETQVGGPHIGIICMAIGQFFHATQMTIEESILKGKAKVGPLYVMGCEGSWGLLFTFIFFFVAKTVACPFEENQCVNGHIDDISIVKEQLAAKPSLVWFALLFVILAASYNGSSVLAMKYTSAVNRSITE